MPQRNYTSLQLSFQVNRMAARNVSESDGKHINNANETEAFSLAVAPRGWKQPLSLSCGPLTYKPGMKTTPCAEPLSGSEPISPGSTQCVPGAQLRSSGILTLPGIIPSTPPNREKVPPHVCLYGYRPRPPTRMDSRQPWMIGSG